MQAERPWYRSWPKHLPRALEARPRPLYALLDDSAALHPEKVCITYQGANLSYSAVKDLSSRFASALVSMGLTKGDRVALLTPNTPQFVIAYFGILKAGGVVVPCSPLYKEQELEHQLRDSGSRIVVAASDVVKGNDLFSALDACRGHLDLKAVVAASLTEYLPPMKRRLASLAGVKDVKRARTTRFRELVARSAPLETPMDVDPLRDVGVLQYTGGTTGVAKGAMLSHANLFANAVGASMVLPIGQRDVALAALPLFHIYGMTTAMNAPLYVGGRVVLLPRFEVKVVMETIEKEGVTSFCGVPTMYIALNNDPAVSRHDLRTVRACISGGAPLPAAVRKRFVEITGSSLVEGYGLTEASPVTHCNPVAEGIPPREGSIGIPLPETDAAIVDIDDPGKFLGVGEVGELAVRGPQVMLGYWGMEDETRLVMKAGGWLLTGDIATMDDDGYFFIVDRKKDMIDVGGFKVYPREVEEVLFTHAGVKEAAVVGMPDGYMGEAVKAFVALRQESRGSVSEADLIQFCETRLARYKVPRRVVFMEELPKTLVGKVKRRRLREAP